MTIKEFTNEWKHFCDHIDFGRSNLDGKSIRFMNEMPDKIIQTVKQRNDLLATCKNFIEAAKWDKKEFAYIVSDFHHSQIKKAITKAETALL